MSHERETFWSAGERSRFGLPGRIGKRWRVAALQRMLLVTALLSLTPPPSAFAAGVVGKGTPESCTEAALDAALVGGGAVTFDCGSGPVTITITSTKTIAQDTTIDGGGLITISGGGAVRVFVSHGASFTVVNLTVANGFGAPGGAGGGILAWGPSLTVVKSVFVGNRSVGLYAGGGAIAVIGGTLSVTDSTFTGNSTGSLGNFGAGGAIALEGGSISNCSFSANSANVEGGAIFNTGGPLVVTNSTFSGNSAYQGGGIFNYGTLTVSRSTFSGNSAELEGGGIANSNGSLTVINSTFTGSSAGQGGAIFNISIGGHSTVTVVSGTFTGNSANQGAGIFNSPNEGTTTELRNTVVADSPSGGNCGGTITDGGHNLDDGVSCGFSTANGSLNRTDPQLHPAGLHNNGGPTQTIALRPGSPAIDAGDPAVCAAAPVNGVDQRGLARPGAGSTRCSIGAYEFYHSIVGTGTPESCTEAALDTALAPGGLVTFNCGPDPVTITLVSPKRTASETTIDGGGTIALSGDGKVSVFELEQAALTVQNLTIANGHEAAFSPGGGILNSNGSLTVTNCTFTGNSAGCGIDNEGTLTATNSAFADNAGQGICNASGTATVSNSTFTSNSGGGIWNYSGTVSVTNSTFSDNGVGHTGVGGISNFNGSLAVSNSTFTDNSAGQGGGIFNMTICIDACGPDDKGTVAVFNSTFTGNSANQGGGIFNYPDPEPLRTMIVLRNTVVADSPTGGNCGGGTITDAGHNLDDGTSCGFSAANGSLSSTDPLLDPAGLKDNGGPTQTIALLPGSPAINVGDPQVCASPPVDGVDQRGYARPGTGYTNCSIGAYEYNSPGPPPACTGDCRGDNQVTVDELLTLVNIALGNAEMSECESGDDNDDGLITVNEILMAVNNALSGCGSG